MTTHAKEKKKPGRPKGSKGKPAKGVSMGKADGDPNQGQLEGMEEERIAEIEQVMSSIVNNRTRIKELREQNSELGDELAGLLHTHELTSYRCAGRVATLMPGEETIVIKKAKQTKHE